MTDSILVDKDDRGVCTLTLNRPQVHNAFDSELVNNLLTHLSAVKHDKSIRVVMLTGAENTFSSGADINTMRDMVDADFETNHADALKLAQALNSLFLLPKITIARINGSAYGGALGLIACCDIAIASSEARYAFTEVKLGIVPAVISPYIVNAIGVRHAQRLFLSAKQFDGYLAQAMGLIHHVVTPRDLDSAIEKELRLVLAAGPSAIKECKIMCHIFSGITDDVMQNTVNTIAKLRISAEGQEGLSAFLEKRSPDWLPQ
ncbi:MAG: enoyl-CoA hydratase-related protein [Thiohalomonadales bacterium]